MADCLQRLEQERLSDGETAWVWLGQGGFAWRFGDGGPTIVIDPYLSDTVEKLDGLTRLSPPPLSPDGIGGDLLLVTHDHLDHFDEPTIRHAVLELGMRVAGPGSALKHYRKMGLPEAAFLRIDRGESFTIGGVRIEAVFADHSSGDGEYDAVGFVLTRGDTRIYHVGDSEFTDGLREAVGGLTANGIAVPINGRWGNMNADEAAALTAMCGAGVAIPMHFGLFAENTADPGDFEAAMRRSEVAADVRVPILYEIRKL